MNAPVIVTTAGDELVLSILAYWKADAPANAAQTYGALQIKRAPRSDIRSGRTCDAARQPAERRAERTTA